jgi:hypothetical protein
MTWPDRVLLALIYAPAPPALLLLLGWWGSLLLALDTWVPVAALTGLAVGVLLDLALFRGWMAAGYRMPQTVMALLYVLYSVCLFGFLMGVPVGNILPGLLAGVYAARRASAEGLDRARAVAYLRRVAWFCVLVLALACAASAALALRDPYTSDNLRGMLGLSFKVTAAMIYGLILVGGGLLLAAEYWLVKLVGLKTLAAQR